jgi:excisionase family DNA binding protein
MRNPYHAGTGNPVTPRPVGPRPSDLAPARPAEPLLLSKSETARRLGVSPRTVFALGKSGQLRPVKIGRRALFDVEDIRLFIERAKAEGGAV